MITNDGKELIKYFEGLKLKAYKCPAGVVTIGYGHTLTAHLGGLISENQANELLEQDLLISENKVEMFLGTLNIPECHLDCLVSLAYNLTTLSLKSLIAYYKKDMGLFRTKILLYCKDINGKELKGLIRRRRAELRRFDGWKWTDILRIESKDFLT